MHVFFPPAFIFAAPAFPGCDNPFSTERSCYTVNYENQRTFQDKIEYETTIGTPKTMASRPPHRDKKAIKAENVNKLA